MPGKFPKGEIFQKSQTSGMHFPEAGRGGAGGASTVERMQAYHNSSSTDEQQRLCWVVLWCGVKYQTWAIRYWISRGLVLKRSYWHFPSFSLMKATCLKFQQWRLDRPWCHLRDSGCVYTVCALQGIQNVQRLRRIFPPPLIWNNKNNQVLKRNFSCKVLRFWLREWQRSHCKLGVQVQDLPSFCSAQVGDITFSFCYLFRVPLGFKHWLESSHVFLT